MVSARRGEARRERERDRDEVHDRGFVVMGGRVCDDVVVWHVTLGVSGVVWSGGGCVWEGVSGIGEEHVRSLERMCFLVKRTCCVGLDTCI